MKINGVSAPPEVSVMLLNFLLHETLRFFIFPWTFSSEFFSGCAAVKMAAMAASSDSDSDSLGNLLDANGDLTALQMSGQSDISISPPSPVRSSDLSDLKPLS